MLATSPHNKLKQYLRDKKTFAGAAITFGSTRVTEVMADAGFDFLMIDLQHGYFDKSSATDSIRAVAASKTIPLARVSENSPGMINDLLDAGALGVVVPMVNSAADAEAAVRATLYPPLGARSKGGSASLLYGEDYARRANDEILPCVMIETAAAIAAADEILAVPGVGLCLVGTSDLSFEMGVKRNGPEIRQMVAAVGEAGKRHGVSVGVAVGAVGEIAQWADLEPAFFLVSHDYGLLKDAACDLAANVGQALR